MLLSLARLSGVSQLDTDSAELLTRVGKQWGRWLQAVNPLAASAPPLSLFKSLPLLAAFSQGPFLPPKSTEVFNGCLEKWFEPKSRFSGFVLKFFAGRFEGLNIFEPSFNPVLSEHLKFAWTLKKFLCAVILTLSVKHHVTVISVFAWARFSPRSCQNLLHCETTDTVSLAQRAPAFWSQPVFHQTAQQ